ncbi:MAG: hypothetical protein M1816_008026 [Peltula sp. TS41687]|nr:MAG: hypothetical protein M1816_008026 [Peltula sp. TS41687]
MCGRYALALRPSAVRHQLQHDAGLPIDDAPDDEATRQSYNVAPGYYELIYRADVPDWGAGASKHHQEAQKDTAAAAAEEGDGGEDEHVKYKLQAMKWGLVPSWTKRNPDYGSMLKTINCRDDSLIENRGLWNSMKQKKRCVVICQGFYEWLKKNGAKEKIPHFVRRKDGSDEKLYTYTIITTDSNDQLKFLHDRMPVILDQGDEAMRVWLDPKRSTWSKELQSLLKPYKGELEVYPVSKEVGKVGNNSPSFIVPISSSDNKQNIANFFSNKKGATKEKEKEVKKESTEEAKIVKKDSVNEEEEKVASTLKDEPLTRHDPEEDRKTIKDEEGTEDNAPLPVPPETKESEEAGMKRKHEDSDEERARQIKTRRTASPEESSPKKSTTTPSSGRKTRSATSNGTTARDAAKKTRNSTAGGSKKITNFFAP